MKFSDINYSVGAMLIMTAFISFLGFALENIWLTVRKGYMDNRNMFAPFLLGYGVAVMGFYLLLGTPENPRVYRMNHWQNDPNLRLAAYFIIVFLCVSLGEILLGKTIEKVCGVILWDYTSIPLHITRYTSIPTSIGFSVIIIVFMDCFFERIMDLIMRVDPAVALFAGAALGIIMVVDFFVNAVRMIKTHSMMTVWRLDIELRRNEKYLTREHNTNNQ